MRRLAGVRIGVDLDNTIACYDRLLHTLAVARGLADDGVPATKLAVRDHLRRCGRDDAWTALQGEAYGVRMGDAVAFPGCSEALAALREQGAELFLVSHRTRAPYAGPPADLHQEARNWLERHGLWGDGLPFGSRHVFLETTRAEKCHRMESLRCVVCIDGLPEGLVGPDFPGAATTRSIASKPSGAACS